MRSHLIFLLIFFQMIYPLENVRIERLNPSTIRIVNESDTTISVRVYDKIASIRTRLRPGQATLEAWDKNKILSMVAIGDDVDIDAIHRRRAAEHGLGMWA